jgi:hypothetical protein
VVFVLRPARSLSAEEPYNSSESGLKKEIPDRMIAEHICSCLVAGCMLSTPLIGGIYDWTQLGDSFFSGNNRVNGDLFP